jgi:dienelactone hydrolase
MKERAMAGSEALRFRDRDVVFGNGVVGRNVEVASANPVNYYQVLSHPGDMPPIVVDGKLFLPPSQRRARAPSPIVVVVPGSLGISNAHLAHAEAFTEHGIAAFVLDPFGARNVKSTSANQAQYSFAASAFDVLAAARTLASRDEIDASRIGAQGHSRGASAVLTAAMRRFSEPVLGPTLRLRAIYAAYPWCGHQFLDPDVGDTVVRAVIGDRDDWCLPAQAQGHIQAIRLRGGNATIKLFAGAGHSFDRETAVEFLADGAISTDAPIHYIADDGALILPTAERGDSKLVDYDTFVYGLRAGYGRRGAHIGSRPGDPERFRADMLAFWTEQMR